MVESKRPSSGRKESAGVIALLDDADGTEDRHVCPVVSLSAPAGTLGMSLIVSRDPECPEDLHDLIRSFLSHLYVVGRGLSVLAH